MSDTHRLRNITLLLASTMTVMAGATIAPALPEMEKAFAQAPHAELLVKLVMTIPGLVIVICAPVAGMLLDRWRKKSTLLIATLLYGLAGTSGFFFSDSLYAILTGRVFLGVAVAGIMVGCTTLLGDYFTGLQRSHYMGLQAAFGGFGGVLFLAAGGVLADTHWTMPFLIYASAFAVVPCLLLFINEPSIRSTAVQDLAGQQLLAGETGVVSKHGVSLLLGMCYFMAVVEILALYMVPVHFPFYVNSLEMVSGSQTGFAIALMLLMMAFVSVFYRLFKSMVSFQLLHAIGLSLLALGYVLLGNAQSYPGSLPGLAIAGIGLGIMRPNLVDWLMSFTPPEVRGRVTGGLITFFFAGQFMCPVLTQPLVHVNGYAQTFRWVGIAVFALAGVFAWSWTSIVRLSNREKLLNF